MKKNWLDEELIIDYQLADSLLNSYFEKINEESVNSLINSTTKELTVDEINKIKKIYITKIFENNDLKSITLTYRDLFNKLSLIFNPLNNNINDIDITTEIYQLTMYFYEQVEKKDILDLLINEKDNKKNE